MSRKRSGIVKLETTSVPFLSVLVSMHVKIRPKKAEVGKKHFNGREASPLFIFSLLKYQNQTQKSGCFIAVSRTQKGI